MNTGNNGNLLVLLTAIFLLTSSPTQVESGPVAFTLCVSGCKVALSGCVACGVGAASVTLGAAAPAAGVACTVAYTACMGTCAAAAVAPTP